MEIFLPDSTETLHTKLRARLKELDQHAGILCKDTLKREAGNLRESIIKQFDPQGDLSRPIIQTGHQPVFYHPGLLIKDHLAGALARFSGGYAINLVVDTDQEEIDFAWPALGESLQESGAYAKKENLLLNSPDNILKYDELNESVKKEFATRINAYGDSLDGIFTPGASERIRRWLEISAEIVAGSQKAIEPGVKLRERWLEKQGVNIHTIYVSDIIKSKAFAYFVDFIVKNAADFRSKYNEALVDYRLRHRIKNKAQPLPNLDEGTGELPFWSVENGERVPFTETTPYEGREIYPRAITLTLFCRLFLCDMFIHGKGGGRYDQITNTLLRRFFRCPGAPFTVASATLHLEPRPEFPLETRNLEDIISDERALKHDPTRFLASDHELVTLKQNTLAQFKEPDADRTAVHKKLMEINQQTQPLIQEFHKSLPREKQLYRMAQKNRTVFFDRTLPFFFYDLSPILEAVEPYAARATGAKETAGAVENII